MYDVNILKNYFPKSFNSIIGYSKKINTVQNLVNTNITPQNSIVYVQSDEELNQYIIDHTENLKINVFISRDSDINAFTIPSMASETYIKLASKNPILYHYTPILSDLVFIVLVYSSLLRIGLDATVKNDKLIFTYNKIDTLTTFQTTKMMYDFKDDVRGRFAIQLHELGHWNSIHPYLATSLVSMIKFTLSSMVFIMLALSTNIILATTVALIIFLIFLGISSYIRSINETNADKFAKKLGYGNDLARTLYRLRYGKTAQLPNDSIIENITSTFSFKLTNFFHRIFTGYPDILQRYKNTNESNIIHNIDSLIIENIISSNFKTAGITDYLNNFIEHDLKPISLHLDTVLYKYLK